MKFTAFKGKGARELIRDSKHSGRRLTYMITFYSLISEEKRLSIEVPTFVVIALQKREVHLSISAQSAYLLFTALCKINIKSLWISKLTFMANGTLFTNKFKGSDTYCVYVKRDEHIEYFGEASIINCDLFQYVSGRQINWINL